MTIHTAEPYVRSLLRIVAGFMFSLHGAQKLFGFFGGMGGRGGQTAEFLTLPWIGGFLELAGGLLLLLGLFTVPVAFVLSGEMAVAYFMAHASRSPWPIVNGGELAVLYCFIFLDFFSAGAGPWSLDWLIWKRPRATWRDELTRAA